MQGTSDLSNRDQGTIESESVFYKSLSLIIIQLVGYFSSSVSALWSLAPVASYVNKSLSLMIIQLVGYFSSSVSALWSLALVTSYVKPQMTNICSFCECRIFASDTQLSVINPTILHYSMLVFPLKSLLLASNDSQSLPAFSKIRRRLQIQLFLPLLILC